MLRVLYFPEPKDRAIGGVNNVAYNLTKGLTNKVSLSYYPVFTPNLTYLEEIANVHRRLVTKQFEILHFNIPPHWTQGGYSLFKLAQLSNTSTLMNIHGIIQLEYSLYGWEKNALNRNLLRIVQCCRFADKLVTYSEFMKHRIVKWYKISPEKIAIIPNGVNTERFMQNENKLLLEGDPAILYLGHLSKSADILIDAISRILKEIPTLKLHIVGGGDIAPLKELAFRKNADEHVVFHGPVAPENTPAYYKAADFFIFPAIHTPAGITILEAMASGTPVIASNRGGTVELISNGYDGLLYNPDNVKELPDTILSLHSDPKLKKRLLNNALRTVTLYDWEKIAQKYVSLYKTLSKGEKT